MSTEFDDLVAKVQANPDVETSVVLLVNGVAAKIDAAKNDPAALAALSSQLTSSAETLAGAVTSNTSAGSPTKPERA